MGEVLDEGAVVEEERLLEGGDHSGGVAQLHEDLFRLLDGQFEFGSVGLVEAVVVADL